MGPKYDVSCELDLPDGAMAIPENITEMVVVIDQTTGVQRLVVASACSLMLGAAVLLSSLFAST
jgi:hypothetical protein